MATVYILNSRQLNRYYIGSCKDLKARMLEHQEKRFSNSFTAKADDWESFLTINDLTFDQARKMEAHIKRMKSRKYIESLQKFQHKRNLLRMKFTHI